MAGANRDAPPPPVADGRTIRARQARERRRAEIVAAARTCFAEKGYHGTGVADVIRTAGVARGTFYLYFESKRVLFDEILAELFERLRGCLKRIEVSAGNPPALDQLRSNMERTFTLLLENPDYALILQRSAVGVDAECDAKLAGFYKAITDLIGRSLRQGMQMGLLRRINPELGAQSILGSVKELVGYLVTMPADERPPLSEIVDEVIRHNLEGLLNR